MELPATYMTLVSDSIIKHSTTLIAHCQMLHIAIVVVVEALGLSLLDINSTAKSSKEFEALKNTCSLAVK